MIEVLLREELRSAPYHRSGSRAWRECNKTRCHGWCKHHEMSCALNFALDWYTEKILMTRGKSNKKIPQFSTTFIRCELSSEDKKQFVAWQSTKNLDIDTLVIEMLQANHKISFSYSEHNDSFICSVTGKTEDCDNSGKCYTSHAKDYVTALRLAVYKFHVIFKGQAWEDLGEESDFG